jgi:outer membrane receptor protein involved in Fe transport
VTYVTDPRWRANLQTKYTWNNLRVSWDMNYIQHNLRVTPDSYQTNPGQIAPIWNGSYTYHNMQVGYKFNDTGLDVYLGVDNVFDKDPPINYFGADIGSALYDNIGRYMYLGASYKF